MQEYGMAGLPAGLTLAADDTGGRRRRHGRLLGEVGEISADFVSRETGLLSSSGAVTFWLCI